MNKTLVDFITKVSLCGILVLIFIVLFNLIREPYSIQSSGFQSEKEVKEALQHTRKVGKELDRDFMDDYVDNLKAPDRNLDAQTKRSYYVPLPKEYSVVNYSNNEEAKAESVKKNK